MLKIEEEPKKLYKNKTIRLDEETIEKLNEIAGEKNISFNKLVEKLIIYGIENLED